MRRRLYILLLSLPLAALAASNPEVVAPDIIITDVPYGNLVEWEGGSPVSIDDMAEQLHRIAHEDTILAICMDKSQKLSSNRWKRLEKNNVGKRRFEILRKN